MLGKETGEPLLIAAKAFHDEQMMELVPFLSEVDLLHTGPAPPPPQGLVQVKHGHIAEVRHAGNVLQEPEALDRLVLKHHIDHHTEEEIGSFEDEGAPDLLPAFFPLPHLRVGEGELLQLVAHALRLPVHILWSPIPGHLQPHVAFSQHLTLGQNIFKTVIKVHWLRVSDLLPGDGEHKLTELALEVRNAKLQSVHWRPRWKIVSVAPRALGEITIVFGRLPGSRGCLFVFRNRGLHALQLSEKPLPAPLEPQPSIRDRPGSARAHCLQRVRPGHLIQGPWCRPIFNRSRRRGAL
mmetsp:Transcript_21450/g.59575  ORF Transcript_21450/g.59575 Transcript_21450/m.59575 type:complete len:295 (-) Transcript_21450:486-1370(-)